MRALYTRLTSGGSGQKTTESPASGTKTWKHDVDCCELQLSLPRLAAICSRCGATVSWTNAPVGFVNTRIVPIGVADGDPIAKQVAVLSNGCDGSATGTINLWHVNDTAEGAGRQEGKSCSGDGAAGKPANYA
jgi:hypothetical protein